MKACSLCLPRLFHLSDYFQFNCSKPLLFGTPARLFWPVACMASTQQCLLGLSAVPSAMPAVTFRSSCHVPQHGCRTACTVCAHQTRHLHCPSAASVISQSESAASTTQVVSAQVKQQQQQQQQHHKQQQQQQQQQQQKQRMRRKRMQKQISFNATWASGLQYSHNNYPDQLGQMLLLQTTPSALSVVAGQAAEAGAVVAAAVDNGNDHCNSSEGQHTHQHSGAAVGAVQPAAASCSGSCRGSCPGTVVLSSTSSSGFKPVSRQAGACLYQQCRTCTCCSK